MKKIGKHLKLFICMIAIFGCVITACEKDQIDDDTTSSDEDVSTASDNSTAENLYSDVFDQADQGAEEAESSGKTSSAADTCRKVRFIVLDSALRKREITIDFGTGCTGQDGRTRKGKIIVVLTGTYKDSGSSLNVTLEDYYVNDHKIEGTKTVTNNGRNASGNLSYTISVQNGKITTPDTATFTWESTRTREWLEGESTVWPDICDDVYSITGSASGTNRAGKSFSVDITTSLRKEICCRWLVSGVVEITPDGKKTRKIDFGSGTCDSLATVSVGSFSKQIILR